MSSAAAGPLTGKTRPRHRLWRGGVLAAAFVAALGLGLAACGSPHAPSASSASDSAPWSTARVIAYAECMRAHGVTNYPEPSNGDSDISISGTGINMGSATFQSARSKCYQLLPGGVPKTHATKQQITQALESAQCMRGHGFPDFPDPIVTATPPSFGGGTPFGGSSPGAASGVSGYSETYSNGILLKVPNSIDVSSPAFQAAAKACGSPLYVPGGESG